MKSATNTIKTLRTWTVLFAVLIGTSCMHSSAPKEENTLHIQLNQGQKWKVNAEMMPYVLEAEQILLDYSSNQWKELARQLNKRDQALIKNCTMEGKSHEELHKWLHPHLLLVEALAESESETEANQIINQLKSSFQTYHQYFQ